MRMRRTELLALLTPIVLGGLGCGPELGPVPPEIVSGHYRAQLIELEDACEPGSAVAWSADVTAGYSRDAHERLYEASVPIRAVGVRLEVPEPQPRGPSQPLEEPPWKMQPLVWDAASYELEVAFEITFCESYRHVWSAVALDEETIHVTREGIGCGPGDGASRICDHRIDIEYALVEPCEAPCELVDDRETRYPGVELGGDVILRGSRCAC